MIRRELERPDESFRGEAGVSARRCSPRAAGS
jgi:hypothetical protein